jgi:hypothetical protein
MNSAKIIKIKILYFVKDPSLHGSSSQILNPNLFSSGRGRPGGSRLTRRNLSQHEVVEN